MPKTLVSVRVKFKRTPPSTACAAGWGWDVLRADSLVWVGGGWSAGPKAEAVKVFEHDARAHGWRVA